MGLITFQIISIIPNALKIDNNQEYIDNNNIVGIDTNTEGMIKFPSQGSSNELNLNNYELNDYLTFNITFNRNI